MRNMQWKMRWCIDGRSASVLADRLSLSLSLSSSVSLSVDCTTKPEILVQLQTEDGTWHSMCVRSCASTTSTTSTNSVRQSNISDTSAVQHIAIHNWHSYRLHHSPSHATYRPLRLKAFLLCLCVMNMACNHHQHPTPNIQHPTPTPNTTNNNSKW